MGKALKLLFGALAVILCMQFFTTTATASGYTETEPNDELTSATSMKLNTTYTGHSTYTKDRWGNHSGDFDYYKVKLDKPGQITVSMKNHQDYTWSFTLQDSNKKTFIDAGTEKGVQYTNRSVGLPAGTYYVKVYGNQTGMENISYELKVSFTAGDTYEKEPNNELASATSMKLNTTYIGYSTYTKDRWGNHNGDFDYYKFTLDKPGQVTVSMKNHRDYTWSFILQDSKDNTFIDADTENGVKIIDQNITHTNKSVGLPAGTYYVKVYGNQAGMENVPYELKVNFTAGDTYEKEPNNELTSATIMKLNTTYTGHSTYTKDRWGNHGGDFDYYKFTLDKPGQVTVFMKNHQDYTWSFILHDPTNRTFIDADTENGVKIIDQNITHTNKSVGLPAGTYYVKVYGNQAGMENTPYELKIKFMEGDTYEKEPNNGLTSATNIKLDTTYTGYSTYNKDRWGNHGGDFDYYKFKLDKPDQVTISMKNHQDYTWSLILQDSNNKTLIDTDTEKGSKYTNRSIGLPAGTYYVKIYGNQTGMENTPYSISVAAKSSTDKDKVAPVITKVYPVDHLDEYVIGLSEPGSTITVNLGTKVIGTTKANSKGLFIANIKPQAANTTLDVYATDEAGNKSKAYKVKVQKR